MNPKHTLQFFLCLFLATFFLTPTSAQINRYVKVGGAGTMDGTSWANASGNINAMIGDLKADPDGGEIWVAKGTYIGTFNIIYSASEFNQVPITFLGGFPSTGNPGLGDRDSTAFETILSGNNSVQIMYLERASNSFEATDNIIINGFTFSDGKAVSGNFTSGGAVHVRAYNGRSCTPIFINCRFINNTCPNRGGAVFSRPVQGMKGDLTFIRCHFEGNSTDDTNDHKDGGGAVYLEPGLDRAEAECHFIDCVLTNNEGESGGAVNSNTNLEGLAVLKFTNTVIKNNRAFYAGGGVRLYNGTEDQLDMTNCLVTGNKSDGFGGGIVIESKFHGNPILTTIWNSTFSGNEAIGDGGAIYNSAENSTDPSEVEIKITNTISWNNKDASGTGTANSSYYSTGPANQMTTINYSLLEMQNPTGTGNLDGTMATNDPDFVTPLAPSSAPSAGGDFHLQSSSPCLDAGTNAGIPADTEDVDGDANTTEPTPDLDLLDRVFNSTADMGPYEDDTPSCAQPTISNVTTTDPTCALPNGGNINITASGGGTLEYSIDNGGSWDTDNDFDGLSHNSYIVKVRLQSDPSCMTTWGNNPVVLNEPTGCCTPPTISNVTTTDPTCALPNGGNINITASGGGTLEYSIDNGGSWDTDNDFDGLSHNSYIVKVRLQSDPSCMTTWGNNPVVLNEPTGCCTPPTISNVTTIDPTCALPNGGNINITASGGGTLEYSIDNGGSWDTDNDFDGLSHNNYNVKVRLQSDPSCMTTWGNNPVVLNEPTGCGCTPPAIDSVRFLPIQCEGTNGIIIVEASGSGALEYSIDDGGNWETFSLFNPVAGTYHIKVRLQSDPSCEVTYVNNPIVLDPAPTGTYHTYENPFSIDILDEGTIIDTMSIGDAGIIYDIHVGLVGVHTYVGDLTFTLTSPSGTSVTLIENICGGDEDFDVTLNDRYQSPLTCPLNVPGLRKPANPLSAFQFEDPQGIWTLSVNDNAGGDVGVLQNWSISLCRFFDTSCRNDVNAPGAVTQGTHNALFEINSNGTVNGRGEEVFFKAGSGINLNPGFEVPMNEVFDATIDTCANSAAPEGEGGNGNN